MVTEWIRILAMQMHIYNFSNKNNFAKDNIPHQFSVSVSLSLANIACAPHDDNDARKKRNMVLGKGTTRWNTRKEKSKTGAENQVGINHKLTPSRTSPCQILHITADPSNDAKTAQYCTFGHRFPTAPATLLLLLTTMISCYLLFLLFV